MMMRSNRLFYRFVTDRSSSPATTETLYRRGGGVAKKVHNSNNKWISTIGRSAFCRQDRQQQQRNTIQNWNQKGITVVPTTTIRDCNNYNNNRYHSIFRSFSTTSSPEQKHGEGQLLYEQALQLTKEAQDMDDAREEEKSQLMYKAWKKTEDKVAADEIKNPKSQGVVVVKTLVKDVRKHKNDHTSNDKRIEALALLKEAATAPYDHPEASIKLGNMILKEASHSISSMKQRKHTTDLKKKTYLIVEKKNATKLVSRAMELFQKAGTAGSRVGWYNLGHLLWTGFPPLIQQNDNTDNNDDVGVGEVEVENDQTVVNDDTNSQIVPTNKQEALVVFQKAIDLGDSDAMYLVGVHYLDAKEEDHQDQEKENEYYQPQHGIKLIEQAAAAGHGGALYYLALLHLNGEPTLGIQPSSLPEFVTRLDQAVEAGNVDAKFVRGNSYYHGTEGYPPNFRLALDDFLQAADAGHAEAAVSAGAMLHNGVGDYGCGAVEKDQRKSFELYQLAGELGSDEGWMNVVDCYQQGLGVPKSEGTAQYIKETMLKEKKK
mmetsp:Transcript_17703/g.19398  ORF Transcript_17703/g.19398 Transcript_17703/m.19398 type:complete len:545 (-) Transcript_17703:80-1714(-)